MADIAHFHRTDLPGDLPANMTRSLAAVSFAFLAFVVFAGTRPFQSSKFHEFGLATKGSPIEVLLYIFPTCVGIACCTRLVGLGVVNRWVLASVGVLT